MSDLTDHQQLADLAVDTGTTKIRMRPFETLQSIIFYGGGEAGLPYCEVVLNTSQVVEQRTQTKETRFGARVVTLVHHNEDGAPYEDWWELNSERTYWDSSDTIIIHRHFETSGVKSC